MASIGKKLDTILCATALLAVLSIFVAMSATGVMRGLSSADDAATAYVAKNIAVGRGYGFPRSNGKFFLFDYMTTSIGPTLILPVALLIWLFGPVDQLPGATALGIVIIQLVVAAIVLARRFGWAPTFGFLAATLWLLILAESRHFYFGMFLGEPATFGFILIGIACLAGAKRDRGIAVAGVCLSLALVTKLIAVFPVAGIVGAWLVVCAFDRLGLKVFFRRALILLLATSSLPLLFEVAKVVTVGLVAYRARFKENVGVTKQLGVGSGDQSSRFTTFRKIFLESYISRPLLTLLVIGFVLLLVLSWRRRDKGLGMVGRFGIFAWSGAAVHLAYILLISSLWSRYFWVGIALVMTAICAPLLGVESRLRICMFIVLLVGALGFDFHPLYGMKQWLIPSSEPAERAAVVRLLDANPDLPYTALGWSSISDVVYLRRDEGIWAYDPNAIKLDRDFIALINFTLTDQQDRFFKSVTATCEPLTPLGKLTAYRCGHRFGEMYLPPAGAALLQYNGAVDRRDCERVAGWVIKTADPKAEIKVGLYIDGQLVETVTAQNLRPDLRKLGTGRYGFSFKMPGVNKDGKPHTAKVRIRDFDYALPFNEGVFPAFECKK